MTKDKTVDNKGVFLPYNFTTILNFLAKKVERNNVVEAIDANCQHWSRVWFDYDYFVKLFALNQQDDKTS